MITDYDFDRGIVYAPAGAVRINGKQKQIFDAAIKANGRVLNRSFLLDVCYGHLPYADMPDEKIIDVFVCKLRKKIKGCSVEIQTVRPTGYRREGAVNILAASDLCPCCGQNMPRRSDQLQ